VCSCAAEPQEQEDNSQFKTQNSSFDNLNYSRNGKIARLSRELRDRINLALFNRCTAKDLARALNQMPEVKAVLAQYFNGRPLKRQNVDEWRHGGYRDWLHHRQILEQQRELAADAKDLSDTAKGTAESLFGILTLNYADLIMNRDKETPEEFEKKRKELSLVSQDISRMHRCHINTRRVEVQEARLERDEEKTEEQLHFKFMEWAENPAIRRALILEPMEANRQSRQKFGMPPTSDDILVEKLTRNDPYFNPPNKKPSKSKPKPTEKGGASVPASRSDKPSDVQSQKDMVGTRCCASGADQQVSPPAPQGEGEPKTEKSPVLDYAGKTTSQLIAEIEEQTNREKAARLNPSSTASEKTPASNNDTNRPTASPSPEREGELKTDSHIRPISPIGPIPPNSKLKTQNSPLPKPPLTAYERALREGKTHLEALYIHSAPSTQPTPPPQTSSAWDSFSQPVRPSPYAWSSHHATSGFQLRYG
jgi:hypothetical protein